MELARARLKLLEREGDAAGTVGLSHFMSAAAGCLTDSALMVDKVMLEALFVVIQASAHAHEQARAHPRALTHARTHTRAHTRAHMHRRALRRRRPLRRTRPHLAGARSREERCATHARARR